MRRGFTLRSADIYSEGVLQLDFFHASTKICRNLLQLVFVCICGRPSCCCYQEALVSIEAQEAAELLQWLKKTYEQLRW